jgi:hypothetical protein
MTSSVHVFTSAAVNYLPKVRLLFQSLRKHHPEWTLHLALADALPDDLDSSREPIDVITPAASLSIPDWQGWSFCHQITELATAIKPWMLEHLLNLSGEGGKVIYLDPDMVVFSRLDDIVSALDEASIVLTPHQTKPEATLAAVIDNEICSLKHGIYNLGFLAVSNDATGRAFARWWAERTYYFCRDDIPNGLFTDQRWIDLVPAFFSNVAIMRSGRHNLATWNITTRDFQHDPAHGYSVDGEPLGFYHFTGFDSGAHRIMAAKNGGNNPALKQLVSWYSDQTLPLKDDPLSHHRWAFGVFDSGAPIKPEQRLVYRYRLDLQRSFPNPFAAGGYEQWWSDRAAAEYGDLFQSETKAAALRELTGSLTPGFVGSNPDALGRLSAYQLMQQAISDPRTGISLARRTWEILRQEGIKGIRSRLA